MYVCMRKVVCFKYQGKSNKPRKHKQQSSRRSWTGGPWEILPVLLWLPSCSKPMSSVFWSNKSCWFLVRSASFLLWGRSHDFQACNMLDQKPKLQVSHLRNFYPQELFIVFHCFGPSDKVKIRIWQIGKENNIWLRVKETKDKYFLADC